MDMIIYILGSGVLIWYGYHLLKMGIKAVKNNERPIGTLDPKMGVVTGPLLMLTGICALIKVVIIPLLIE